MFNGCEDLDCSLGEKADKWECKIVVNGTCWWKYLEGDEYSWEPMRRIRAAKYAQVGKNQILHTQNGWCLAEDSDNV